MTNAYTIDCTYGHLTPNEGLAHVFETDDGLTWYVVDGSENVNCTTDEVVDGCHVEDLTDVDAFMGIVINSSTQFERVMAEHLAPEMHTQVLMSIEIDACNSAFQDDNANDEVVRILKGLIEKIESNDIDSCKIKDVNGNNVGDFYLNIEEVEV